MIKYYTTEEAAQILGKSERRIRAKLKQGHFPSSIPPAGWQISHEDIEANLQGNIRDKRKR